MLGNLKINFLENEGVFYLKCLLPGVKKEDISIDISGNKLLIEATKEKNERYFFQEFSEFEKYSRSIDLNTNIIDLNTIESSLENGILTISIKKKEDSNRKKIEIK